MEKEHFVTCGQMKVLERRADEDGLSYYQMMENAGTRAAQIVMERAAYRDMTANSGAASMVAETGAAAKNEADHAASADTPGQASDSADTTAKSDNTDSADAAYTNTTAAGPRIVYTKVHTAEGFVSRTDKSKLKKKVLIFCGKGNNGGDGFVAARRLHDAGYDVNVVLVDGPPKTTDSITNFEMLSERGISICDMTENGYSLLELKGSVPDVIVDAIYGTGFHGKLNGNGLKAAIYINSFSTNADKHPNHGNTEVVALDIPSGLSGDLIDEKELETNSVRAHCTVTFHAKKPVHLQKFAAPYCGRIVVADIGIDEERLWKVEV